jgi:hypothetical protein
MLSLVVLSILVLGGTRLLGRERYLLRKEVDRRLWGWLMMGCLSAVTLMIAIMQRPRPSYMFVLGVSIRVIVGLCIVSIFSRLRILSWVDNYFSLLAAIIITMTPSYYINLPSPVPNSLSTLYGRLRPFENLFEAPGVQFSAFGWVPELCNYLTKTTHGCKSTSYFDFRKRVSGSLTLGDVLNKEGINLFYAEESIFADPPGREFVTDPSNSGWNQIASEDIPGRRWMLFKKNTWHSESDSSLAEIVHKGHGLSLKGQWYGFETVAGDSFRWVKNDADIQVGTHDQRLKFLILDVEPGPGMVRPLLLHITSHGTDIMTERLSIRRSIKIPLSSAAENRTGIFRLHVDGQGKATPTDARILNFRVFNVALSPE